METQFTGGKHGGGSGFSEEMEINVDFEGCIGIYQGKPEQGHYQEWNQHMQSLKGHDVLKQPKKLSPNQAQTAKQGRQAVC